MTVIPYMVGHRVMGRSWWTVEWEIVLDLPDDWHQDEGFPPEEWRW